MNDYEIKSYIMKKWGIKAFFHFTDIRNIPSIKERGLLPKRDLDDLSIGFTAVSNGWSQDADLYRGLDAFVHLCFRDNHPMAFARQGCNTIVFLTISCNVMFYDNVLFTNDISNKRGVELFSIDEFENKIDCEVLFHQTDWRNRQIHERLTKAEKSEILIPRPISVEEITFPSYLNNG